MKERIKEIQQKVGVTADGILGPKTLSAIEKALGMEKEAIPAKKVWPKQSEVRCGNSIFGKPGESGLVNITPAYQLYYDGQKVKTIRVHKAIAQDVKEVFEEVLAHYGEAKIKELGLDQYGGSYNYRKTTNASSLSMHAWGIALDFAPDTNAMKTKAPKASLSKPECEKWWEIWEAHGAVSMGRTYDKDWMHVQFARF